MRKIEIVLVLWVLGALAATSQPLRVLFLGNSYTAVNNLPQMVASAAASAGDAVEFNSNTPGGCTFQLHTSNASTLSLIAEGGWDYVVLQEQSQMPSFPITQVETECFPYAAQLDALIRQANPCTETVFYMTWGRKNGDASNCAVWPPVCTYEGMDSLLNQRYRIMAEENQAILSPVGALWHHLRLTQPGLELYSADESHPSLAGSYAAACSFYSVLFRKNPELITDPLGLDGPTAELIRQAARAVVFDSLEHWLVGTYDPQAQFSYTANSLNPLEISFENLSHFGDSYTWDFGDGANSGEENPVHVFPATGSYSVTLVVKNCAQLDTMVQVLEFIPSGLESGLMPAFPRLYPNPVGDFLFMDESMAEVGISSFRIVDPLGRKWVGLTPITGIRQPISVASLPSGLYWLIVERPDGSNRPMSFVKK